MRSTAEVLTAVEQISVGGDLLDELRLAARVGSVGLVVTASFLVSDVATGKKIRLMQTRVFNYAVDDCGPRGWRLRRSISGLRVALLVRELLRDLLYHELDEQMLFMLKNIVVPHPKS